MWYPEETKIHAATLWAATRNWGTTAELSKVSVHMLKKWAKEPWWHNIVERVVKDKNDELDGALTDIIHECQAQIKDRLTGGDPRINFKTGEVYYVPLDSRALTMSLAILFDKRQLIRGEATSRTESISADKRLEFLKTEFEKFSKAQEISTEYHEVEDNGSGPAEQPALNHLPEGHSSPQPE